MLRASPETVNQDGRQQGYCMHGTVCGDEVPCERRRKTRGYLQYGDETLSRSKTFEW
jgi:hypothetical protein